MKTHTTNYFDTFIEVAEDCPAVKGEIPPLSESQKSIALLTYEILVGNPYRFTSDEVLFQVFAIRNQLSKNEMPNVRAKFFSKGQACFRSSPLTKRYGWGIHSNSEGKIALLGMDTDDYAKFVNDPSIKKVKAMRSSR